MKKIALAVLLVLAAVSAALWAWGRRDGESAQYRFVTIEKGDLQSVVSATGTLDAVTTVQVGTQVSGIISALYADYNDHVKQGQIIARLDTSQLQNALRDAEASLERSQAQLHDAQRNAQRVDKLFGQQLVSESDRESATLALEVAKANVASADVSVARAKQNLDYAIIRAPISGVVIDRAVDVGQTVAASLAAPELFKIAADLSQMQILAAVDESDIGKIHPGQEVRFTVQAFPDKSFHGKVREVRLQATTQDNVVSYSVVVDVSNPGGELLPGMTATTDFLVATAKDVFKVSNTALRFRPSEEMMAELRQQFQSRRSAMGSQGTESNGSRWHRNGGTAPTGSDHTMAGAANENHHGERPTLLWYLDDQGKLAASPVKVGITDGQMTEISGPKLKNGMQVIAGIEQSSAASGSNPFQSSQPRHRPRGPGF